MKKTKLIATIMTICLAITTLAYGVYAATNLSFTIGANIAFEVDNLFIDVTARVIGAYDNSSTQVALGETTTIDEETVTSINNHLITYSNNQVVSEIQDWTVPNNLFFNSSDVSKKIKFRIEVVNYTPNSDVRVTITPSQETISSLALNGISGNDLSDGNNIAVQYDGTSADTAVAIYELSVSDLVTTISQVQISFNVVISKHQPYQRSVVGNGVLPWSTTEIEGEEDNHLVTWYSDALHTQEVDYDYNLPSNTTFYGVKGPELLTTEINANNIVVTGTECTLTNTSFINTKIVSSKSNLAIPPYVTKNNVLYKVVGMTGYSSSYSLFDLTGNNVSVTIPNTIEIVGEFTFAYQENVTSVQIPNSVTTIGHAAFSNTGLTEIDIPDSVVNIDNFAFYYCTDLNDISLPSGLTQLENAFDRTGYYNNSSNWVNGFLYIESSDGLVNYLIKADNNYFTTNNITVVNNILNNTKIIAGSCFESCTKLITINIPNCVTSLGSNIFYSCTALKNVSYPNTINSLPTSAFEGCTALQELPLPTSITSIGSRVFQDCTSLINVSLPSSITSIEQDAFLDCTGLQSIIFPSNLNSIGGSAFRGCGLRSVTIPDSVTTLGNSAFENCTSLQTVVVGNSIQEIPNALFDGCSNLSNVTLGNSVRVIQSAFDDTKLKTDFNSGSANALYLESPNGNRYLIFVRYTLTSYTIENGTIVIGADAFKYSKITGITIPNTVTHISDGAFQYSKITGITIPNTVTHINDGAFQNAQSLTSISIPSSVQYFGCNLTFAGCTSLQSVNILANINSIGTWCFYGCSKLTSVSLPNSVTSIEYGAFDGCSLLSSITLPNSLTTIGTDAFRSTKLNSIIIPNTVTSIGNSAFRNCQSLTSVVLSNHVTTIGQYAFNSCTSLTSIDFDDNTNNWYIYTNSTYSDGETAISSTDLSNNSTAATLLKTTYYTKYWKRK